MDILPTPGYFKSAVAGALLCLAAGHAAAETVVIVSIKNPVGTLNAAQVSDIFLGRVWVFPTGARAIPLDQDEGAPARDGFYLKITGKSPAQMYSYWSKIIFTGRAQTPKEIGDGAEVRKMVAQNVNMIGYVDKSLVDSSVKIVLSIP